MNVTLSQRIIDKNGKDRQIVGRNFSKEIQKTAEAARQKNLFITSYKLYNMNNLAFTLSDNEFQFKTLLCKQYVTRFQWNNDETKGRIYCGTLLPQYSYSTIDFQANDSLALNYHPKEADGFFFMINRLSNSGFVQLMTEKNLMVDYSPRKSEVYIIPANRLFSFTFAPQTTGKSVFFFVSKDTLKNIISPTLIKMLESKSFMPLSEMMNETLYEDLCLQSEIFFNYEDNMNSGVIISLLSILRNLNDFAEKTNKVTPMNPYYNMINVHKPFELSKQIA